MEQRTIEERRRQAVGRAPLGGGAGASGIVWAQITAMKKEGTDFWLECKLVRWQNGVPTAYGDAFAVEIWGTNMESWDLTDPPLAVGNRVFIFKPTPPLYPQTLSAWYLWTPVRGTCEAAP